jgi:UDP-N-acetylmuramate dehydrogenase
MGDVGVWEKQPLVLVNYGQATGEDIYAMAQDVRLRVKNCFGVKLEPEVAMV